VDDPAAAAERERLLLHEGAALRALAHYLVQASDADDLVQDAHAAALAAPAATVPFLTPWLRVTLRNLARVMRRGDARRRTREQAVAAVARTPDLADPAALALQAELVRDVGAAVQALDEPFRTVILLRFWHGLLPEAIAERLGVPRNTVRSRLQRGLERLRAVLDRNHGDRDTWQRSLAAFAAPSPLAATGGIAAGSILGWFMQGKLIAVGAAVLVAAFVGTWWWQAPALPERAADAGSTTPAIAVAHGAPAAIERSEVLPASDTAPGASVAPQSKYHVLMRGRCVDERGAAVAGARVELRADMPLPLDATGANATTQSGADGTFALALVPAVGTYDLDVGAEGRVAVHVRWDDVEPGRAYDLGDLVLQRGGRVVGRVVDETRAPLPGVTVAVGKMANASPPPGTPTSTRTIETRTAADGTFAVAEALLPGNWIAAPRSPHERGQRAPFAQFRIEAGVTTTGVELVCCTATGSLRVQVVDERGAGIADAQATTISDVLAQAARADANGWLVLPRYARDTATHVQLVVSAPGHDVVRTAPLAWGIESRVVLTACTGVSIEVLAHDGKPVDAFGLRLSKTIDNTPAVHQAIAIALPCVPRAAGRVWLPGLPNGRYFVWVEPDVDGSAPFATLLVVDASSRQHVLRAPAAGARRVRVVDAAQRPVGGTVVELVQTLGDAPVDLATRALSPRMASALQALLLLRANTDVDGELELTGAAGTPFTVRVLGPGHRPIAVADVRLDAGLGVLVVPVDVGASVSGTFGPADLLARLGPSPDEVRYMKAMGERGAAILEGLRPVVVLRPADGGKDFPEKASDGAVQDDGTFRIDGVPPGSWRVFVRHIGRGTSVSAYTELATLRDLGSGEHRRIELDGSSLRSGSLRALVLVDGEPFANATVHVRYRRPGLAWGKTELAEATPAPILTEADGRFSIEAPPGEYSVQVQVQVPDGKGGTAKLRTDQFVAVAAGAAAEATFALQRRTLRVRVLRADGTPAADRKFSALQDRSIEAVGVTDGDGWLEIASVPVGAFDLVAWPLELADVDAQTEYMRAHPYPQWLDVLVRIGPLQMESGQSRAEIERRLPR
jgi:RNA polymerase sigma-70 factor (ECF subfamily)